MRASFILRTSNGTNSATYNSCVWKSVDIKSILGELWEEYDYFNLSLKQIAIDVSPAGSGFTTHGVNHQVYMKGLNWENCSYNVSRNVIETRACIGFVNHTAVSTAVAGVNTLSESMCNTFRKGCPMVDIDITLYNVVDMGLGITLNGTGVFSQHVYFFEIIPCESYNDTCAILTLPGFYSSTPNSTATRVYNNINLRSLMGNMFNKYKLFSIELIALQSTSITATIDNNCKSTNIQLYGLPFQTSYDTSSKTVKNFAVMGAVDFSNVSANGTNYFDSTEDKVIFQNPSDIADIVIRYFSCETNSLLTTGSGALAAISLMFKIRPVI